MQAVIPFVIYILLGFVLAFAIIVWTKATKVPVWQFLIIVNLWPFVLFYIFVTKLLNWG